MSSAGGRKLIISSEKIGLTCLLTEAQLRSGVVLRMASYVRHRTDRVAEGGGKAILVRHGIDHHALPVECLQHLEATAIT